MNQEIQSILAKVDHTLLAQGATWAEIRALCDDGVAYGCASVCIPASYVAQAAEYLGGKLPVCTVIGFPNGYDTTAAKCFEAADAVKNGATEVDMVINIGWVKDGLYDKVLDEIRQIIGADGLIFQDLNDLIDAVRAENPDIQQFECSVFNGVYVTRDVDQQYLDYLDSLRNDDAKAVQLQNEVENLEMHNEG